MYFQKHSSMKHSFKSNMFNSSVLCGGKADEDIAQDLAKMTAKYQFFSQWREETTDTCGELSFFVFS
jgi:hypothetical protein